MGATTSAGGIQLGNVTLSNVSSASGSRHLGLFWSGSLSYPKNPLFRQYLDCWESISRPTSNNPYLARNLTHTNEILIFLYFQLAFAAEAERSHRREPLERSTQSRGYSLRSKPTSPLRLLVTGMYPRTSVSLLVAER